MSEQHHDHHSGHCCNHGHDHGHSHQHAHHSGGCHSGKGNCQDASLTQQGQSLTRRDFMKGAVGAFALLWGGMTLYPFISYLASAANQDQAEAVSSVSLGKPDDIKPGTGKNFKFGSKPALVYRDKTGNFHAYSAVCTHLGCTVQYQESSDKIWCACHGGTYDPINGKNLAGPPPKPLDGLNIAVVNNQVVVSKPDTPQA